ncbi:AraC family transcriptional regulator [Aliikangiella marina]|uniref:AraC family transcriptional regulator n=1 Tax=Aliikangiella marina TaxID=1712262 RepID=A0A545T8S1_9GAMM|nr:helix-turn-helix domain-containing protein [Aliikangiella marina]TQV73620.1 AraC family transcriptional regulator [Aliikangiella marina]
MQLSFVSLVYLIAFSHALIMAIALWRQTEPGQSGRILAALLLVMAYKLFEGGVTYSNLYRIIPHTLDLLPGAVLVMGPVFYAYIHRVVGKGQFHLKDWLLHLSPAILLIAINSPQVFVSGEVKVNTYAQFNAYEATVLLPWRIIILLVILKVHLATYLGYAWKMLKRYEDQVDSLRADFSHELFTRHKQLCLAFIALESVWVILFLLQQTTPIIALDYVSKVWLLFMAVIVLSMGYYGLKQPSIIFSDIERSLIEQQSSVKAESDTPPEESVTTSNLVNPAEEDNAKKYAQSIVPDSTAEEVKSLIEKSLKEQHLYLDDKLSLTSLADKLSLKPHLLSQVINQYMQTNFYQLVNTYRVNHAIKLLSDTSISWPLERVALESGFGNRVTFNKAFKSLEGCTPSAFRKQIRLAS